MTINKFANFKEYFDLKFMKDALIKMSPLIAQSLLLALMNVIDIFMIGSFLSQEVINGVGAANTILSFLLYTFYSVDMAGSIYASQYLGDKNINKMQEVNNIRIFLNLVIGTILIFILFFLRFDLIRLLVHSKTDPDFVYDISIETGALYLAIVIWSYWFFGFSMAIYQNMNECSKTFLPLLFTLFPVLLNVVLNYFLLAHSGSGVEGVAIPTLVSRVVEFILILSFLLIKKPIYRPMKKFYFISKDLFFRIFKTFFSIALGSLLFVLSLTVQAIIYSKYGGPHILSGSFIVLNVMNIFYAVFNSYSVIVPIYIGKSLGVGDTVTAKQNLKKIMGLITIISTFLSTLILISSFFIFDFLFSKTLLKEAIETARFFLGFQTVGFFFLSFSIFFFSVLRAGGYAKLTAFVDVTCTWVVIILIPFLVSYITSLYYPDFEYKYIFLISTLGEIVQFSVMFLLVKKINWAKKII